MNNITSYISSNPEDIKKAQDWLNGIKPIPELNNSIDILGDIDGFDITGW